MDQGAAQNLSKGDQIGAVSQIGAEIKDMGDIANFVQTLLQQVQDKFQVMSEQILNRIDEMGHRIDDLEQNLNEVIQQTGITDEMIPNSASQPITKSSSMPTDKPPLSSN